MARGMLRSRFLQIVISLFLLVGLLLAACGPAATPTPTPTPRVTPAPGATPTPAPTPTAAPTPKPKPIKIGVMDTVLLGFAESALEGRAGLEMAIEDISGGTGEILGRKVELIYRDTEMTPELALRRARELVEEVGVDYIMGAVASSETLALLGYSKEIKKILFNYYSESQRLTDEQGHRYFFRAAINVAMRARSFAFYFADKPYRKFYIIAPDYEFGYNFTEFVKKAIPEALPDAQILGELYPPLGEADFRPYITAIIGARPDVLFSGLWADDMIAFIKQAQPYGLLEQVVMANIEAMAPYMYIPLGQDLPEGLVGNWYYYFLAKDTPQNRAFIERFRTQTGKFPPGPYVYSGYMAMKFLLEAIKKAGTTETEAVANALEGLTVTDPIGEAVTMRALEHQAAYPIVVGSVRSSPDYDFKVFGDFMWIEPDKAMRPEAEIIAARAAAGG